MSHEPSMAKSGHDRAAPYWAAGLVVLCATGLATTWLAGGDFWHGYVLDMTGPAWNYILFRGRFTTERHNLWTRTFTPWRTVVLFLAVCFGIEGAQFLEWYDATFDPWDLVAYGSLLIPVFLIDLTQTRAEGRGRSVSRT